MPGKFWDFEFGKRPGVSPAALLIVIRLLQLRLQAEAIGREGRQPERAAFSTAAYHLSIKNTSRGTENCLKRCKCHT
ncbi:hypothetical protein CEXT_157881 [Caerostris extrusa]|uniref:Uncharacterized protein n=1 Tax=Caerostris extrusa TaxID=172846 RepID=A0AAV4XTR7_CAEEX|nr:hypothetical protein CEXT_157881 [Caerostris extrusa]